MGLAANKSCGGERSSHNGNQSTKTGPNFPLRIIHAWSLCRRAVAIRCLHGRAQTRWKHDLDLDQNSQPIFGGDPGVPQSVVMTFRHHRAPAERRGNSSAFCYLLEAQDEERRRIAKRSARQHSSESGRHSHQHGPTGAIRRTGRGRSETRRRMPFSGQALFG